MTDLRSLLRQPDCALPAIQHALDSLDHSRRVTAIESLGRWELARLYRLAEASAPLEGAHFVPGEHPVFHDGWNSLPFPRRARRFQKVFARTEEGLIGFNEGESRRWVGPGYFRLVETPSPWQARGALVVDYFQVPTGTIPVGWPRVVPNWWGLQVFVYNGTRDFMRRVSSHVSVGKPWARWLPLPFCFALVRRD